MLSVLAATNARNPQAQDYIRSLPVRRREPFKESFPHANPLALDLLPVAKMLTIDPAVRISCEQAPEHPYLAVWHDPTDEPVCPAVRDHALAPSLAWVKLTSADSQKFVYSEEDDSIDGMKKIILEEVNLIRSEVTATAQLKEDQWCVSQFRLSISTIQCAIDHLPCILFSHGSNLRVSAQIDDRVVRSYRRLPD